MLYSEEDVAEHLKVEIEDGLFEKEGTRLKKEFLTALAYTSSRMELKLKRDVNVEVISYTFDGECKFSSMATSLNDYPDSPEEPGNHLRSITITVCEDENIVPPVVAAAQSYGSYILRDNFWEPAYSSDLFFLEGIPNWAAGRYVCNGKPDFKTYVNDNDLNPADEEDMFRGIKPGIEDPNDWFVLFYRRASMVEAIVDLYGKEKLFKLYEGQVKDSQNEIKYSEYLGVERSKLFAAYSDWMKQ